MKKEFNAVIETVQHCMFENKNFWQGKAAYIVFDYETNTYDYLVNQENWLVTLQEQYLLLGTVYNDGEFVSACMNFDDEYECEACEVCDHVREYETYLV